jgi:hypothetical protein
MRKSFNIPNFRSSKIQSCVKFEGESIENKIVRLVTNKEPIEDGAPLIFTEKKDGVLAGYNVRTDRWEVAAEAMDYVAKSEIAKSDGVAEMHINKDDVTNDNPDSNSGLSGSDGTNDNS